MVVTTVAPAKWVPGIYPLVLELRLGLCGPIAAVATGYDRIRLVLHLGVHDPISTSTSTSTTTRNCETSNAIKENITKTITKPAIRTRKDDDENERKACDSVESTPLNRRWVLIGQTEALEVASLAKTATIELIEIFGNRSGTDPRKFDSGSIANIFLQPIWMPVTSSSAFKPKIDVDCVLRVSFVGIKYLNRQSKYFTLHWFGGIINNNNNNNNRYSNSNINNNSNCDSPKLTECTEKGEMTSSHYGPTFVSSESEEYIVLGHYETPVSNVISANGCVLTFPITMDISCATDDSCAECPLAVSAAQKNQLRLQKVRKPQIRLVMSVEQAMQVENIEEYSTMPTKITVFSNLSSNRVRLRVSRSMESGVFVPVAFCDIASQTECSSTFDLYLHGIMNGMPTRDFLLEVVELAPATPQHGFLFGNLWKRLSGSHNQNKRQSRTSFCSHGSQYPDSAQSLPTTTKVPKASLGRSLGDSVVSGTLPEATMPTEIQQTIQPTPTQPPPPPFTVLATGCVFFGKPGSHQRVVLSKVSPDTMSQQRNPQMRPLSVITETASTAAESPNDSDADTEATFTAPHLSPSNSDPEELCTETKLLKLCNDEDLQSANGIVEPTAINNKNKNNKKNNNKEHSEASKKNSNSPLTLKQNISPEDQQQQQLQLQQHLQLQQRKKKSSSSSASTILLEIKRPSCFEDESHFSGEEGPSTKTLFLAKMMAPKTFEINVAIDASFYPFYRHSTHPETARTAGQAATTGSHFPVIGYEHFRIYGPVIGSLLSELARGLVNVNIAGAFAYGCGDSSSYKGLENVFKIPRYKLNNATNDDMNDGGDFVSGTGTTQHQALLSALSVHLPKKVSGSVYGSPNIAQLLNYISDAGPKRPQVSSNTSIVLVFSGGKMGSAAATRAALMRAKERGVIVFLVGITRDAALSLQSQLVQNKSHSAASKAGIHLVDGSQYRDGRNIRCAWDPVVCSLISKRSQDAETVALQLPESSTLNPNTSTAVCPSIQH